MIAENQGRTFLRLLKSLRPHLRGDRNLPSRIQQCLAGEKRFGSRDRRLYRELLYTTVRYLPWIEDLLLRSETDALRAVIWLSTDDAATRPLKNSLPPDWPAATIPLQEKAAFLGTTGPLIPEWFRGHCPAAFEPAETDAILARSPLWLRLQTDDPQPVLEEFMGRQWKWQASTLLPGALQLLNEADVTKTDAYIQGLVEVQDLGSQLLLEMVAPAAGTRWLDACAGAGGKTLQLARMLGKDGHVAAIDPRRDALAELKVRADRAHATNIHVRQHPPAPDARYDGVLVDAPCSGTGTWRRAPHLKWCTNDHEIQAAARLQGEILDRYARHVAPGGLLVYCSRCENEAVVNQFLSSTPGFSVAPCARTFGYATEQTGLTLLPSRHNTDGFYVCVLKKE